MTGYISWMVNEEEVKIWQVIKRQTVGLEKWWSSGEEGLKKK